MIDIVYQLDKHCWVGGPVFRGNSPGEGCYQRNMLLLELDLNGIFNLNLAIFTPT